MDANYRVFFAQPVDYIDRKFVLEQVQRVRELLSNLPIEVIAPYCDENWQIPPLDPDQARSIVEKDILILKECDIILVDLSQEKRQAVGMIFEMAYSWFVSQKTIIVYVGDSIIGKRVWINAVAQSICNTWEDVRNSIVACIMKPST